MKTSKDVSTYDIFGPRLHRYTIKDAIGDGNVLGFDVTYYETDFEHDMDSGLTEKELEKEVYASLPFRQAVVADIQRNWATTLLQINQRPLKILDWKTPYQVMLTNLSKKSD